jgi:hypothetical protein
MILINFAYPLNQQQRKNIEALLSQEISQVIHRPVNFDNEQPFKDQVEELLEDSNLPVEGLMTHPVAVILPSHSFIAGLVLVGLHGRMGRFPAVIRFKPKAGSLPLVYEVAEVVDLQQMRETIRQKRSFSEE